jgi:hypothetical protein
MHGPLPPKRGADRSRPVGVREGRRAPDDGLPRDFDLAEDRRGKAGKKTLLAWSLVDSAAASRKPRPKVVAASTDATILLVEVPRHLEGRWGGPRQKARDQVNFVDVDGNDILKRRC